MFLREINVQMPLWKKGTHRFIAKILSPNFGLASYPVKWVTINNSLLSYLGPKAEIKK